MIKPNLLTALLLITLHCPELFSQYEDRMIHLSVSEGHFI